MRVLKDQVLYRLKAYNITQLMAFITTRLEAYYCRRLIDAVERGHKKNQQCMKLLHGLILPF